jgi:hypothetical protein
MCPVRLRRLVAVAESAHSGCFLADSVSVLLMMRIVGVMIVFGVRLVRMNDRYVCNVGYQCWHSFKQHQEQSREGAELPCVSQVFPY